MEMMIPYKKTRMMTYIFNVLYRLVVILLFTPFTLQFWDNSFISFVIITYLIMHAGAFIYSRMYIPTYQFVVLEKEDNDIMPTLFSWIMLTLILCVSIISGVIMFTQGNRVFPSFFMPFFFFMGAFCWNQVIYTVTEALNEKEIKIRIVNKDDKPIEKRGFPFTLFHK